MPHFQGICRAAAAAAAAGGGRYELILFHIFAILFLQTAIFHAPVVESGLIFKGCGETPGIFKLAKRLEVPLAVMVTIEEAGQGPKARCKIPFNVMCLPDVATCEYNNQCCSDRCNSGKCTDKEEKSR